jgi:SAM-dependent methyltransferase/glycosyltransferase involved in cell wall biosynthesis
MTFTPQLSRPRADESGVSLAEPLVSVIIPAFKPEYLADAINSARGQTCADIEILVGDDTPDGRLETIVAGVEDPRVSYHHHGFGDAELNLRRLWERSTGRYVKVLFDDDVLFPDSLTALVAALEAHPASALAFHERVMINGAGELVQTPPRILDDGEVVEVDRQTLVGGLLAPIRNFVGEPSSTLLRRELVDIETVYTYDGLKLDFLADVASYLNLAEQAPLVGVGGFHSAFRQHAAQSSHSSSPRISAGLYEWELIIRKESEAGNLDDRQREVAWQSLRAMYAPYVRSLPEIARLASRLDGLVANGTAGLRSSEIFATDLQTARTAVASRLAIANRPQPQPSHCPVCDQDVEGWLASPNAAVIDLKVMNDVGVVGSRLDKHLCPLCGCNDRDRHLWLYMQAAGLLDDLSETRILHIAPEARLEPKLMQLGPRDYVGGDLIPQQPHHVAINIEQMEFEDDRFDLIICNHVLEHVNFPERAAAEFARCLAPGGHVVAQTPYSPLLKRSMELTVAVPEAFATYYYGQNDHVRIVGLDLIETFHAAGFRGEPIPHTTLLGEQDPEASGINPAEPFFLFEHEGDAAR